MRRRKSPPQINVWNVASRLPWWYPVSLFICYIVDQLQTVYDIWNTLGGRRLIFELSYLQNVVIESLFMSHSLINKTSKKKINAPLTVLSSSTTVTCTLTHANVKQKRADLMLAISRYIGNNSASMIAYSVYSTSSGQLHCCLIEIGQGCGQFLPHNEFSGKASWHLCICRNVNISGARPTKN